MKLMSATQPTLILTHDGAMQMLAAGIKKAGEIGQPQCIVIVDASGETIAQLRMTGAKFISLKSARTKARTAASNRAPSDRHRWRSDWRRGYWFRQW